LFFYITSFRIATTVQQLERKGYSTRNYIIVQGFIIIYIEEIGESRRGR